jgi:hypothetical protein
MNDRLLATAIIAALLHGCVSYEGTYSPDCIAYAGSNVRFSEGRFVWEKFSDQAVKDADGNIVDQFPDYPVEGRYRIEGRVVYMESDSGQSMEKMYFQWHDDRQYLLTTEQFEAWERTGEHADCPLILGENAGG